MSVGFEAIKNVTINAPMAAVWDALIDPVQVEEYMHGTHLSTDWEVGKPITWSGEWQGRTYEDKGTVLVFEPGTTLSYTHWSPMGGTEDKPENYHTVTYELLPVATGTTVTLRQDNNPSAREARKMADDNWGPVLEGLKTSVEKRVEGRDAE